MLEVVKLGSLMPGIGIYSLHFLGRMGVVLTALAGFVSQGTLNFHTPKEWASLSLGKGHSGPDFPDNYRFLN